MNQLSRRITNSLFSLECLLCSIFALASLMFSDNNSSIYGLCIISLVGGTLTFSIAELFQVLRILFRALENM